VKKYDVGGRRVTARPALLMLSPPFFAEEAVVPSVALFTPIRLIS
jgi:hypothetical protein